MSTESQISAFRNAYAVLRAEIANVVVGQEQIDDTTVIALFAGGQVLLDGVPGLATQNPIDQEGTYPLPEAQLDRFFFKILVGYPTADELSEVLTRTTTGVKATVGKVIDREALAELMALVREVPVASHVKDYAVRL